MAVIYVSNIDRRSTEQNVRAVFEVYGPVASVNLLPGFAVVEMQEEGHAQKAISDLSDYGSWVVRKMSA